MLGCFHTRGFLSCEGPDTPWEMGERVEIIDRLGNDQHIPGGVFLSDVAEISV